jgi:GMP synthase (glutamine-hydrolysing)
VLIIDFGSQVTQLIARRLREMGVYCEVHPYNRAEAAHQRRLQAEGGHPLRRPGFQCHPR